MAKDLAHYWKVLQWTWRHYRSERDVTIETANGTLSVSNKDWLIGKHLFVRRDYELDFIRRSMEFLKREGLLPKNETVADIGANLGMISIALLREGFFQKALAFEPSPRNFRLLQKNAAQNGLNDRMKCFRLALSSENGVAEFELAADNSGDGRVRKTAASGAMNEQRRAVVAVESRTFDAFTAENAVSAGEIDLLWIDIQGHEGHFFRGAREFFRRRGKIPVVNEFWGYGINRSGMSQAEYCRAVGEIFSGFYHFAESGFELKSIAEIENLFDVYRKPREIANIILI